MEVLALIIFVLFILIRAYLRSPTAKGARGERRVNSILDRKLPSNEYEIFHDVTLPSSHGSTQIDHIVVSKYGIFVIETKNYTGWIFGDAKSKQWTQVVFKEKNRFMNPLRQNYKHTKAVESFFSLRPKYVHSVVVFVGDAKFKTDVPANVIHRRGLCPYIRSKRELLLGTARVRDVTQKLTAFNSGTLRETPALSVVSDERQCPKCGEQMVKRLARKGKTAGDTFWGCPQFPKCRGVRQL
jgi:restriction system protein